MNRNTKTENRQTKIEFNPFLLIPNFILCFVIGFLTSLLLRQIYSEIKAVEYEDTSFIALKLVMGFGVVSGFVSRRTLNGIFKEYLELSLIILLVVELILIVTSSSGIIQVDYIFHTGLFQFLSFLNLFSGGYFISSLRRFRLWSFLSGAGSAILFTYFSMMKETNTIYYLVPVLSLLILEYSTHSFLNKKTDIVIIENVYSNHPINDLYFYSSLSLFVSHILLYYYRGEETTDSIFLAGGSGLLLCNLIYHLKLLKDKVRLVFIGARILVIINLFMTMSQSNLKFLQIPLFFMDMGILTLLRPTNFQKRFLSISLLSGIAIAFISYQLHLQFTKAEFLYSFLLVIANLVWLPLVFTIRLGNFHKGITLLVSYLGIIYFFSPLPQIYNLQKETSSLIEPIPFQFFPAKLDDDNYVYFNTDLPFINSSRLPKRANFKNRIMILGKKNREQLILTYIKYLDKNSYPFIIFQSNKEKDFEYSGIELKTKEYPLFKIYYPTKGIPGLNFEEENEKHVGWQKDYINSKTKDLKSISEFADVLNNISRYSSGEISDHSESIKNNFFNSYKQYSAYFLKIKNYSRSLEMANLAINFKQPDVELLDIVFKSISSITPEESHISLMQMLTKRPEYKSVVLNKIYPILFSAGRFSEAKNVLEEIESNTNENDADELLNINVEKVKLLIKLQKILEAEETIKKEFAKNPNSPVWKKLISDLKFIKETTFRPYYSNISVDKEQVETKTSE